MKISPNYTYYNQALAFSNRMRVNQNCHRPKPLVQKNTPNVQVYIYEDSNQGIDVNERTYDSFTGLRDKQYLLAVLSKRIEEGQKDGKTLSFAMFDMDNFKSVNELLGYEVGDDFIRFIADSIDSTASENGLNTYRFGGEEFVVIFEDQDEDTQKDIINKIVGDVNSNKYIKAQQETYMENAHSRLVSYSMQIAKVNRLMELKAQKAIYDDLIKNMQTEAAKNDPYLVSSIKNVNEEIKAEYLTLMQLGVSGESDNDTRIFVSNMIQKISNDEALSKSEQEALDGYLKFKFDKSAEQFQVKKWLRDFQNNNGFSITGSVVSFNPTFMRNKNPMQLIGIAGEALKRGKESGKGRGYFNGNCRLS